MPDFKKRYIKEWELMRNTFPEFKSYARPPMFGWEGHIESPWTGRRYFVRLESSESTYPREKPHVHITPRFGPNWLSNGALCIDEVWRPAFNSFASLLLRIFKYMEKWRA